MNKYLRLFRFGNGIMGIVGIIVGALLAAGTGMVDHWMWIVLACLLVVIFMAGGNAINDYIDREIDVTAHPERPIPKGEIKPKTARNLGYGFLLISVLISVPCAVLDIAGGWITTVMVIICAVLMLGYETVLKQRGFVGNMTIAFLTAMIFMVGGSVTGHPWDNAVFAGMAFLVNVGREVSKDIEDMDSDEGRRTLPMSIGAKRASYVACAFFVLGPVLSVYPVVAGGVSWAYYLVFAADVMFLYCAYMVPKDAHRAQKTAKYAMAVALVAFILDVIA
ncbi:MAG: geranylgeranylglycerol-phosphate geranylgeranyltransferase [Thermoplasmata archaeon]|nr:geranylgeranylglycerol-phosphate geranylgeranyltransferase [Thermoplasmata archaeon]